MSIGNVLRSWNWMWKKHDQTKFLFSNVLKALTMKGGEAVVQSHVSKGKDSSDSQNHESPEPPSRSYSTKQRIGFVLGPLLFTLIQLFFRPEGLEMGAVSTLAIVGWVATWWITEALPIPITSLLPIILYPLTGSLEPAAAYAPYANEIIFLIMGGFVLALAMERWKLHKRIALLIVSVSGTTTDRVILGFVAATGFLSLWISNTATTMLMVPIAIALVKQVSISAEKEGGIDTSKGNFVFGKAIMLAIAYSATVGGLGTIVSTPGNAILVAVVNQLYGVQISFAQWMLFGIPIAMILLGIVWIMITKVIFRISFSELPGGKEHIQSEREALGGMSSEEKRVLTIFVIIALCWTTRTFLLTPIFPGITDSIIAVVAAIILCIIPAKNHPGKRLFEWEDAKDLPWGIALLYGCGLSLAAGFTQTGLSSYLGDKLTGLNGIPLFVIILIIVAMTIFMTELMSNGASATMLYPIMGALAFAIGVHPYSLIIAACLATTASFMLPVSTPPNAIVFGTGYIKLNDMLKAGIWLNIIIIILVPIFVYFALPIIWDFNIHEFPESFLN